MVPMIFSSFFLISSFHTTGNLKPKIALGKRILNTEDKNGHSVLIKAALRDKLNMMETILTEHRYMIRESDLDQIVKYLDGDNTTKLGSSKMTKKINNTEQKKFINLYVNKIWDYLKDSNAVKLKTYIETRANDIKEAWPELEMDQIYSDIINVQKKPSLFTPLHFAIKYKNLRIIRCLVFDYNADTSIEDKNGHDVFEYLHLGDINHSKYIVSYHSSFSLFLYQNQFSRNSKLNGG